MNTCNLCITTLFPIDRDHVSSSSTRSFLLFYTMYFSSSRHTATCKAVQAHQLQQISTYSFKKLINTSNHQMICIARSTVEQLLSKPPLTNLHIIGTMFSLRPFISGFTPPQAPAYAAFDRLQSASQILLDDPTTLQHATNINLRSCFTHNFTLSYLTTKHILSHSIPRDCGRNHHQSSSVPSRSILRSQFPHVLF
jgi:hypothetical protein